MIIEVKKSYKNIVDIIIPVFEEKDHLHNIVNNLNDQQLPPDYQLNIIIVDDASKDGTADYIKKTLLSEIVSLIRLDVNSGPAVARNKGCNSGKGKIIILIDADCLPNSLTFVFEHIQALEKNDVSCGALLSKIPNSHFWSKYQNEVFENRVKDYKNNKGAMFTTPNLAFTREHFQKTGGFDEQYFFGFEDRDFLLRSEEIGARIIYTKKACVVHGDQLTIATICRKMNRGGRIESNIFRKRHPEAYRQMPYYKIDAREHTYLQLIAKYIAPLVIKKAALMDKVLVINWFPHMIKKAIVKLMTAFCFMGGTCEK